jgi:hypothetical protein
MVYVAIALSKPHILLLDRPPITWTCSPSRRTLRHASSLAVALSSSHDSTLLDALPGWGSDQGHFAWFCVYRGVNSIIDI